MESLRVLITVKTYPIPSATHDELVCTAGVTEDGRWIRLYPINFRDLRPAQQYRKYQWIQVNAEKHTGRDARKESYRPNCDSIVCGDIVDTGGGDWAERSQYVLRSPAKSIEDLRDKKKSDRTSLGVFRPKEIADLVIYKEKERDWKASFRQEINQIRFWEERTVSKEPPRKVPFKFRYRFWCDDVRCKGHRMQIEDWEVGALFWKMVDKGASEAEAADAVKAKFFTDLCGPKKDTWFLVGTILAHGTWVVIGVFYPKKDPAMAEGGFFPI